MFLYVVSNTNFGHKIGITDHLIKRKKHYTTIFPDIDFLFHIYSSHSYQIEESFKSRFGHYRKMFESGRYSEVYKIYLQYICEHIIRCFHSLGEALVLNHTDHSSIEYYDDPKTGFTNFYLSQHYFLDKFKHPYKQLSNYGTNKSLYIATVRPNPNNYDAHRDKKFILQMCNLNKFKIILSKINNLDKLKFYEKLEGDEAIKEFGEEELLFFNNSYNAIDYMRREIFKILVETKIIKRPYLINKLGTYDMSGALRINYPIKAKNYAEKIFYGKSFERRYHPSKRKTSRNIRKYALGYLDEKENDKRNQRISRIYSKIIK